MSKPLAGIDAKLVEKILADLRAGKKPKQKISPEVFLVVYNQCVPKDLAANLEVEGLKSFYDVVRILNEFSRPQKHALQPIDNYAQCSAVLMRMVEKRSQGWLSMFRAKEEEDEIDELVAAGVLINVLASEKSDEEKRHFVARLMSSLPDETRQQMFSRCLGLMPVCGANSLQNIAYYLANNRDQFDALNKSLSTEEILVLLKKISQKPDLKDQRIRVFNFFLAGFDARLLEPIRENRMAGMLVDLINLAGLADLMAYKKEGGDISWVSENLRARCEAARW